MKKYLKHEQRGLRSYVLRQGRMSTAQQRALDAYYDQYVLDDAQLASIQQTFANPHPIICSIGFGMGESLLEQAIKHPDTNFLGVEVHAPGVGFLMDQIVKHAVPNILIAHRDITTMLDALPDQSIDTWQIFFPDPWHKKRHHKRRLIQKAFLDKLLPKTKMDGYLHIATDWANYAEYCAELCEAHHGWENTLGQNEPSYPYLPENAGYALREVTKYERRGLGLGHAIFDLYYQKT